MEIAVDIDETILETPSGSLQNGGMGSYRRLGVLASFVFDPWRPRHGSNGPKRLGWRDSCLRTRLGDLFGAEEVVVGVWLWTGMANPRLCTRCVE